MPTETHVTYAECSDATMEETGAFEGCHGTRLAYHVWTTRRSATPERVMLFIHGIGAYAAPYRRVADGIAQEIDRMYALDLRGHGDSGERRGDFGTRQEILRDIDRFVDIIRERHPSAHLIISGESMGAMLDVAYAAWKPDKIDSLLLVAPAMALQSKWVANVGSVIGFLKGIFSPHKLTIPMNATLPQCSRDQQFIANCLRDPIPLPQASVRYMWTLFTFTLCWAWRYPKRITKPVLIVQGAQDPLLDPTVPPKIIELLSSKDKELFWVPEAWHTLFSDPQTPLVYGTMSEWLGRH